MMNPLYEQVTACIAGSSLRHVADELVGLLRPTICLSTHPAVEQNLEIGASKVGGSPDLPPNLTWPMYEEAPLPFYAQIRCSDLAASDPGSMLPREGWLYFFYNPEAEDKDRRHISLKKVPYPPESWRVLYYHGEAFQLQRSVVPPSLPEHLRYHCCSIIATLEFMLPGYGSERLSKLKLSYRTFETEEALTHYQDLLGQIQRLSASASAHGIHMLGYPEESTDERENQCEKYSQALGWHNPHVTGRDGASEWVLLLQIDCTQSDAHGGTNMGQGDWFVIYFWIRQDSLIGRRFDQVWLCYNGD